MSAVWKTKWGTRRVRHDPPTLAEAIAAAEGLTEDRDEQAVVAAELMGVSLEEAKRELRRLAPERRPTSTLVAVPSRDNAGVRTLVVERKVSRRVVPPREGRLVRPRPR